MATWNALHDIYHIGPMACDGLNLYTIYSVADSDNPATWRIKYWNEADGETILTATTFSPFINVVASNMFAHKGYVYIFMVGYDEYPTAQMVRIYRVSTTMMEVVFELDVTYPFPEEEGYQQYFDPVVFYRNGCIIWRLHTYQSDAFNYLPIANEHYYEYYSSSGSVWETPYQNTPLDPFNGSYKYNLMGFSESTYLGAKNEVMAQVSVLESSDRCGIFSWDGTGWQLLREYPNYGALDINNVELGPVNRDYIWGMISGSYGSVGTNYLYSADALTWNTPSSATTKPLIALNHISSIGLRTNGTLSYFRSDYLSWGIGESVQYNITYGAWASFLIGNTIYVLVSGNGYTNILKRSIPFPETAEVWTPPEPEPEVVHYRGLNLDIGGGFKAVYIAAMNMNTNAPELLSIVPDFTEDSTFIRAFHPSDGTKMSVLCGDTTNNDIWVAGAFQGVCLVRYDAATEMWVETQPPSDYWLGPMQGMTMVRGNAQNLIVNSAATNELFISYFDDQLGDLAWNVLGKSAFDVNVTHITDEKEELMLGVDADDPYWLAGYWYYHIAYSQDYGQNFYDISYGTPLSQDSVTSIISGTYKYGEL